MLDRGLGDQDLLVTHEAHGIGVARLEHHDVRQVARGKRQVVVHLVGEDQHVAHAEVAQLPGEELGLGLADRERLDHGEPLLAHQLRQDGSHPRAVHLAIHLLVEVLVGLVGEGASAATPERRRRHAGARAAGALLAPRLLGRVAHLAARLLRARALAAVRLVGDDDLVHQRLVVRASEEGLGSVDRLLRLALLVDDLEFHYLAPFAALVALAFTLGRTITAPFLAPGTEPFTMMSERSASTRATSSSCTVRLTSPRWPDMRLPGKTRPGSCAMPMEPELLCESELPCEARFDEKW